MPLIVDQIMGGYFEDELETEKQDRVDEVMDISNNDTKASFADEMDVDEVESSWEGAAAADHDQLGSLLDECLSMAS